MILFRSEWLHLLKKEFFLGDLLVRIHFIIVMIRCTGLSPWEFKSPFPGSLTSTFLLYHLWHLWISSGFHFPSALGLSIRFPLLLKPYIYLLKQDSRLYPCLCLGTEFSLSLPLPSSLPPSFSLAPSHLESTPAETGLETSRLKTALHREQSTRLQLGTLQGYLAHKKQPPPLRPPQGPRHNPTVGS